MIWRSHETPDAYILPIARHSGIITYPATFAIPSDILSNEQHSEKPMTGCV